MKKIVLKTLIITFVISAIFGIFIVISGLWNDLTERIMLSTAIIFTFSLSGLVCSSCYEKTQNKQIPTIGIIISAISCLYFLVLIWFLYTVDLGDFSWKLGWSLIILSAAAAHICLLLLTDPNNKIVNYIRYGTCIMTIIMTILLIVDIFSSIEINWKIIVVNAILIALGTIVTPLLNKVYK